MFRLKIETGGSAFADPFFSEIDDIARQKEVARILREAAEKLDMAAEFGKIIDMSSLIDINGNKVGEMKFAKR